MIDSSNDQINRLQSIQEFEKDKCQLDPDDTPTEVVLEGLRQGLQEALAGQTIPLSQMWEDIDAAF